MCNNSSTPNSIHWQYQHGTMCGSSGKDSHGFTVCKSILATLSTPVSSIIARTLKRNCCYCMLASDPITTQGVMTTAGNSIVSILAFPAGIMRETNKLHRWQQSAFKLHYHLFLRKTTTYFPKVKKK